MAWSYDPENVFAKILRGEIPNRTVYESEHALAFEDLRPQAPVHVLVIPKGPYVSMDHFAAEAHDAEIAGWVRAIGEVTRITGASVSGEVGGGGVPRDLERGGGRGAGGAALARARGRRPRAGTHPAGGVSARAAGDGSRPSSAPSGASAGWAGRLLLRNSARSAARASWGAREVHGERPPGAVRLRRGYLRQDEGGGLPLILTQVSRGARGAAPLAGPGEGPGGARARPSPVSGPR